MENIPISSRHGSHLQSMYHDWPSKGLIDFNLQVSEQMD